VYPDWSRNIADGSVIQIPVCIKGYSGIVEEEQDKYVRDS
jgi:hypothetical protein